MIIQDWIMLIVSLGFIYCMIPQIIMNCKIKVVNIPWITLIFSGTGLLIMGCTFFTLGMVVSPIINIINGFMWYFIVLQKIKYNKLEEKNG